MNTRYSDLIDRVMRVDRLLSKLIPKDIADRELWRTIKQADDAAIAGGSPISAPAVFSLVRGGLLYALDDLEGCHEVFQDTSSGLGSYWHGMLHRREGDFENARYWFRRAGELSFFDPLHSRVSEFSADLARQFSWEPYLFAGKCEQHRFGAEDDRGELPRLQRAEFEFAFDYSWLQAKVG